MNDIQVSVVIPVYNGIKTLPDLINGISQQTVFNHLEVVVIDSGSNDGSIVYLEQFDFVRICHIDKSDFNHGLTRQFAVQHCNGKFIVFTVQDAEPTNEKWLNNFIKPMKDYKLDAICGQQIVPHEKSKNPVQWFRHVDEPKFRIIDISCEFYIKKSPIERRMVIGWDNVNACYTKEILEKMPFADLNFGEDAFWADQALKNGCKIAFTGHAPVHHYHHYDHIQEVVRRVIAEYLVLKKVYNLDPLPFRINIKEMILVVKLILISKSNVPDKFYWMKYNFKIQWAFYLSYRIWCGFSSIVNAEDYINQKVPQSTKNVRK